MQQSLEKKQEKEIHIVVVTMFSVLRDDFKVAATSETSPLGFQVQQLTDN